MCHDCSEQCLRFFWCFCCVCRFLVRAPVKHNRRFAQRCDPKERWVKKAQKRQRMHKNSTNQLARTRGCSGCFWFMIIKWFAYFASLLSYLSYIRHFLQLAISQLFRPRIREFNFHWHCTWREHTQTLLECMYAIYLIQRDGLSLR